MHFGESVNQLIILTDKVHLINIKKKLLKYIFEVNTLENNGAVLLTFELLNNQELNPRLLIISFDQLMIYSLATQKNLFNISSLRPDTTPYLS